MSNDWLDELRKPIFFEKEKFVDKSAVSISMANQVTELVEKGMGVVQAMKLVGRQNQVLHTDGTFLGAITRLQAKGHDIEVSDFKRK